MELKIQQHTLYLASSKLYLLSNHAPSNIMLYNDIWLARNAN